MTSLQLRLDDIEFERLVQLGRSVIPTTAPEWTDHNTHDPGIMLLELISWVADAQIYSLSRLRRDERRAYARLLGIEARGPRPAHGLIWPLVEGGPTSAGNVPWTSGTRVEAGTTVISSHPKAPTFATTVAVTLTTAQLIDVFTEFHDGARRGWMGVNSQRGATFLPFGDTPHAGDRLILALRGALADTQGQRAQGQRAQGEGSPSGDATVAIGVETAGSTIASETSEGDERGRGAVRKPARVQITLEDPTGRAAPRPLEVVADTTLGLARSGVLLVRVPASAGRQRDMALAISSADGQFLRPPRLQQIALNVLPIAQIETVREEVAHFGTNLPDQAYELQRDGVMLPLDVHPLTVRVSEGADWPDWERVADLSIVGPTRRAYTVDVARRVVQFGNGVNGKKPALNAALQVAYRVTAGTPGNLPAGLTWTVAGIAGSFGTNSEPMTGGAAAEQLADLRALARQRSRETRPIVTSADLESAALAFADLGVTRAMELAPGTGPRRVRGTRVLVVTGPTPDATGSSALDEPRIAERGGRELGAVPRGQATNDSSIWFEEVRARLAPRLPLGQRLQVIAPTFVDVRISARLVAARNVDPLAVRDRAIAAVRTRLAIVPSVDGPGWPFGRDVTLLAIKGWLRTVDGVAAVRDVQGWVEGQTPASATTPATVISIGSVALPRVRIAGDDITVERTPVGATR